MMIHVNFKRVCLVSFCWILLLLSVWGCYTVFLGYPVRDTNSWLLMISPFLMLFIWLTQQMTVYMDGFGE